MEGVDKLRRFEADALGLRNVYWRVRNARTPNKRRNWYRKAAKEKARLTGLGWHQEVVRLYALYLRNPKLEKRFKRFLEALHESEFWPVQYCLQLT